MKRLFIYLAVVAMFATTACEDFLTIKPVNVKSEQELLNEEGIDRIITGMYSTLYSSSWNSSLAGWTYGDVVGGDANKGSESNDQPDWGALETFKFTGTNSYISGPWSNQYNGVFRANLVLDMLEKMKDELSVKSGQEKDYYTEAEAQAKFVRALWYFELIKYYGAAVPWVGLEDYQASINPQVSNKENGEYVYIWDNVVNDFQFAYENLPETWPAESIGRPNKWAALAYKAKVMMFQSSPYNGTSGGTDRWSEVKTTLETIMADGVTSDGQKYDLHPSYQELFIAGLSDNTAENVFEVQQTVVGTSTNGNTVWGAGQLNGLSRLNGGWGFLQPSQDLAQSFMVDADGLPYLGGHYRDFSSVSQRVGSSTTISTDLSVAMDPRVDINIGRFGVPFLDWDVPTKFDGYIRDVSNGGIYFGKKHQPQQADKGSLSVSTSSTSSAKNVHLIRYADILLWYAEALIETGTPADARQYVNQVRERAARSFVGAAEMVGGTFSPTTSAYVMDDLFAGTTGTDAAGNYRLGPWPASQFDTEEEAFEALRAEERAEFAMEGRRWFNLTRWGIAADVLNSYVDYEKNFLSKYNDAVYNERYTCMPIPFNQIVTMDGLLFQSENWR